jgi:hypothetical protein
MLRNITLSLLVAIALLVPSFLSIGTVSGQVPHALIGYVDDLDNNKIMGARVFVNVSRSNETSSWIESTNQLTDSLGRYSVDIDGYPSGFEAGDVFNITAIYHIYRSNGNITINTEPAQQLNLKLNFRSHIIAGYIIRPDGSRANHYGVKVTNLDRNESKNCTSSLDGYYRIDISLYNNGYAINEDICVSVQFNGFVGINYGIVSSNQTDFLNITLTDVEKPVLSTLEVPTSIILGQSYRILVWVTDNLAVDSVRLFLKGTEQTLFTRYDMIRDDGSANDWNGDNMPNIQVYGQSTSCNLPIQTHPGIIFFYFEAEDTNNSATLPATNPQSNAFQIQVTDPTPPVLSHTPIILMESAQSKDIFAIAVDNIGISQVTLFYRKSTVSSFSQIQMLFTGNPDEFNATIPSQMYLGTLEYYITCNDTSNNTDRSPSSGYYPVNVRDTTAPIITHTKLNSANVGDTINFTCQVSDTWLKNVWLNFTDVAGLPHNHSMQFVGGNWWNETIQSATGILHYTIWANDTSGNIARISQAMPIYDAGTPVIFHSPPGYLDFNKTFLIAAYVEDNVNIASVKLAYKQVGSTAFTFASMASNDSNGMQGNFTADIPPQASLGIVEYFINANDSINNSTWPALSPSYQLDVLDKESPALSNLSYSTYNPANIPLYIHVNATDNHVIGTVSLNFLNSTGTAWQSLAMSQNFTYPGIFEIHFPAHKPGIVKFYISGCDASGNNATLPNDTPKLNPYLLEFYNTTIPQIHTKASASIGVNQSCNIYITVEDNPEDAETELLYKGTHDILLMPTSLTLFQNGTFAGIIPAQSLSGTVQYFVRSKEGVNILNQTDVFNISVTNQLPVIQHIGVDTAPVGEIVAIVAIVTDDLHIENVTLSWKREGTSQYTDVPMAPNAGGLYTTDLSQDEPVIIQYHIAASDAEGQSQFPAFTDLKLSIMDLEAPSIIHQPIANLTTTEMPIIIATVTDNRQVSSVQVWFKNATADTFSSVQMIQASGTDDYAALLGNQPEGNFTYYIDASDGINMARSPYNGTYVVEVEFITRDSGWVSTILLLFVIVLIAIAAVLVYLYYRRKSIK